tara:strand:- start:561 stop:674 length:114 start_codon:yes stop_codon:yes gene_type:complete
MGGKILFFEIKKGVTAPSFKMNDVVVYRFLLLDTLMY